MTAKPKIFSFFSGAGFLDLGFESEGFEVVFVNEFHRPFMEAYQYSRSKMGLGVPDHGYHLGSIDDLLTGTPNKSLSDFVAKSRRDGSLIGFIGGPPCPDFSVGGKNKGREGANGRLSKSYVDLISQQQPDFFLFENVKGLWRTKRHRAFYEELKDQLSAAGYEMTERLINAIEYGAPQDRQRIILIGFRKRSFAEKLSVSEFHWLENAVYPENTAFEYEWSEMSDFQPDREMGLPVGVPIKLTVEYWFQKNDVANHANSVHVFRPRAGLKRFSSVPEGDVGKKSYKRLHRWRYSPTAAYGNNEVHLHPYKPRRITVAEALAIQSLPKEFELPPHMSLSNMFKCVGNGVPYLAARSLALILKKFLETQAHGTDRNGYRPSYSTASK